MSKDGTQRGRTAGDPKAAPTQRDRLVAAFSKAASEQGYARLELTEVLRRAGVSRATFESHFESKEQALTAAQDAFIERLWQEACAACEGPGRWPEKASEAVGAIISAIVEARRLSRVFFVEAAASSLAAAERQNTALDRFAALLREGRRYTPAAEELPPSIERLLIGGVAAVISRHLLMEEADQLIALEPQLVEFVLLPYLGTAEARQIATGGGGAQSPP